MHDDQWSDSNDSGSSRTLADVFMIMALLLLTLMLRSMMLPDNVLVPVNQVVPPIESPLWQMINLSHQSILLNGQSYPTFEAALLANSIDSYILVEVGDSTGKAVIEAEKKVQALGMKNVNFH